MASSHVPLHASPRATTGSGATRRLRREGFVPGVLYAKGDPAVPFALPALDLHRALHGDHGRTAVFEVTIEGSAPVPALLKDWQLDPVRSEFTHVDFQQVDLTETQQVSVPLVLVGQSVGVRDGGVLGQPVHEITVLALPDAIPEHIEIDVTALDTGGVLHLSDLAAPEGVEIVGDPEMVVASVTAPSAVEEPVEGEVEEEEGEPEVVGQADADSEPE